MEHTTIYHIRCLTDNVISNHNACLMHNALIYPRTITNICYNNYFNSIKNMWGLIDVILQKQHTPPALIL